jgi:hypothetical protein
MTSHHLSGSFDVTLAPHEPSAAALGSIPGATFGARRLDKRYHGPLQAEGQGLMLSAVTATAGSAGYVALERVDGTLLGRAGSFVLQHAGLMNRGAPQLVIDVVPDSATGALAGLAGRMAIRIEDGRHCYDFDITLPDSGSSEEADPR